MITSISGFGGIGINPPES